MVKELGKEETIESIQLIEQTKEEIKKQTEVVRTELDTFLAKISTYVHLPDQK